MQSLEPFGGDAITVYNYRCRRRRKHDGNSCSVPSKRRSHGTVVHNACVTCSLLRAGSRWRYNLSSVAHIPHHGGIEKDARLSRKRGAASLWHYSIPQPWSAFKGKKLVRGRAFCSREAAVSDVDVPIRMHLQSRVQTRVLAEEPRRLRVRGRNDNHVLEILEIAFRWPISRICCLCSLHCIS